MDREGHIAIEQLLLGYSIPQIDQFMDDIQALKAYGPSHRIYKHSTNDLMYILESFGRESFRVALLHLLVDYRIIPNELINNK